MWLIAENVTPCLAYRSPRVGDQCLFAVATFQIELAGHLFACRRPYKVYLRAAYRAQHVRPVSYPRLIRCNVPLSLRYVVHGGAPFG
ncbi:MAG: hypothetical protein WCK32_00915 [Chlorobiaceae bacterium]